MRLKQNLPGLLALCLYGLCIPAANWTLQHVGTLCQPDGPCLIPVAPGLMAPSGVLLAGAGLVLRDIVQRLQGLTVSVGAVIAGTIASAALAPEPLVYASAVAFGFSEVVDAVIFTPLQKRGLVAAVAVAAGVGLVVDSVVFLQLAFGSLEHLAGQILGKAEMVLVSLPIVHMLRLVTGRPADDYQQATR